MAEQIRFRASSGVAGEAGRRRGGQRSRFWVASAARTTSDSTSAGASKSDLPNAVRAAARPRVNVQRASLVRARQGY